MPIVSSELKFYGSAAMPDNSAVTGIGGAIDTAKKVEFVDVDPAGAIGVASDGPDTRQLIITGRLTTGEINTETLTLNGVTQVNGTKIFDRILKMVLSAADASRTVTVKEVSGGETLATFEPNITEIRRPFYDAEAAAAGGSQLNYHEKIFAKNTNVTNALLGAVVKKVSDPSGLVDFGLATSQNDSDTNGAGNNRHVAPSGITFDSSDKNVPGNDLGAGSAMGVWLRLSLPPGTLPMDTSFSMRLEGRTI